MQLPAAGSAPAVRSKLVPISASRLPAQPVEADETCNLELIDSVHFDAGPTYLQRKPAVVSGWLLPKTVATTEARARLRFSSDQGNQVWEIDIDRWTVRSDVVASLGGNVWDKPGFAQKVDLDALPPATYKMTLVFEDSTKSYICDKGRELVLK